MRRLPSLLVRTIGLGRRRRQLREAVFFLALASGAVALLPFRRAARVGSRRGPRGTAPDDVAVTIAEVRSAVETAAARVPFRAKCFERGLAAQMMLRRRGIDATLYYGAAGVADGALKAHVWVRAGDQEVIGCENSGEFTLLAEFSCTPRGAAR